MVNSMAPFLLLGFFLAGIMHVFVPASLYRQHLSKPNFKSVLYSTLIGIPIPLCSCGVIPTAMSLRKEGASKGSVISFLIATPQTGVDSILATYSMMGLPFAIVRPIAALVTALFGGALTNASEKHHKGSVQEDKFVTVEKEEQPKGFWNKIKAVFKYAYFDMMQDIGKWLVVGLIIAGLITAFVPESFFTLFAGHTLLSILLVLVCAIPMYVCATGSIPIAIALMMKGLSPGAALVLLMAGPAVNVASMIVLKKVMGTRALFDYLLSIILGATAFALIIDYAFPRELFVGHLMESAACCGEGVSWFRWVCTGFLTLLLANALIQRFFGRGHKHDVAEASCDCATAPTVSSCCQTNDSWQVAGQAAGQAGRKIGGQVNGQVSGQVSGQVARQEETWSIHIKGLKCNHCVANCEKSIKEVPGITGVIIDLRSGNATVSGKADHAAIKDAVECLGFTIDKEL